MAWGQVENGHADLLGLPREVVEEYSKRRAQILGRLEERASELNAERRAMGMPERMIGSVQEFEIARRETRAAKNRQMATGELAAGWERSFEERFGQDPTDFVRRLLGRTKVAALTEDQRMALYRDVASQLTESCSTFTRYQVIQAIAETWAPGMPADQLVAEAARFLESGWAVKVANTAEHEVITLRDGRTVAVPGDDRLWTTADMLGTEREVVSMAQQMAGRTVARVPEHEVARAIAGSELKLSDEQAEMVRRLCSGPGLQVVEAPGGTGKTAALAAAVDAWSDAGYEVCGAAPSAKARDRLRAGAGCETQMLDRLLVSLDRGHALRRDSVVILDEAGMVATRKLHRLLEHATSAAAKVVLIGDREQLPSIEAGGAFQGLADRLGAIGLRENRRQEEAWLRDAVDGLRSGDVAGYLRAYEAHGGVVYDQTADQIVADMTRCYFEARDRGEEVAMIAFRRQDRDQLNAAARAERVRRGEVAPDGVRTASGLVLGIGDEVVARENGHPQLNRVPREVINGTRGRVMGVSKAGELDIETDTGRRIRLPATYVHDRVELAYAGTTYSVQSDTVDRCFRLATAEDASCEDFYTGASRERYMGRCGGAAHDPLKNSMAAIPAPHRPPRRQWRPPSAAPAARPRPSTSSTPRPRFRRHRPPRRPRPAGSWPATTASAGAGAKASRGRSDAPESALEGRRPWQSASRSRSSVCRSRWPTATGMRSCTSRPA
jgi:ATP-dependent exoDNAse (exonuclease V) alpha subunit